MGATCPDLRGLGAEGTQQPLPACLEWQRFRAAVNDVLQEAGRQAVHAARGLPCAAIHGPWERGVQQEEAGRRQVITT